MDELHRTFKDSNIRIRYLHLGRDLQVVISGGQEHIGAAALAVYRDSEPGRVSVSHITVYGHREDELVRTAALRLSKALHCTIVVSAGIHFDHLTTAEIEKIVGMVDEMISELIEKLS